MVFATLMRWSATRSEFWAREIYSVPARFADTQREPLDMIALHLVGQMVYLILYLVRTPERGHVHFMVRLHGGFVELGDEVVHLVDLLERVIGETYLLLAQTVGVLNDVFRVVADTLQVADRADSGDEILVVELAKLAIREQQSIVD